MAKAAPAGRTPGDALAAAFLPLYLLGVILAWPQFTGAPVHPMLYYGLGLYAFMRVAAVWPEPRRRVGVVRP